MTGSIPRLYFVHPRQGERFCLRLLLLHVRGATNFADLRTPAHGGAPYSTFREAAIALGLLNDEDEWRNCLDSAKEFVMPAGLRDIFATILFHASPADPLGLWIQFARHLSEDFLHRFHNEHGGVQTDHLERAVRRALGEINRLLKEMGSCLSEFPMLPQEFDEEDQAGDFVDAQSATVYNWQRQHRLIRHPSILVNKQHLRQSFLLLKTRDTSRSSSLMALEALASHLSTTPLLHM